MLRTVFVSVFNCLSLVPVETSISTHCHGYGSISTHRHDYGSISAHCHGYGSISAQRHGYGSISAHRLWFNGKNTVPVSF